MAMCISAEFLHPCYCRLSESARRAAGLLYAMSQLLNQAVGDAVSDMLMVEAILIHKKVCLQAYCIYNCTTLSTHCQDVYNQCTPPPYTVVL